MKVLILLLLTMPAKGQDTLLTYSNVVEVPGATKEQLFIKARQWFNETFKSSKDVLQIDDKETGELSGKGFINCRITEKRKNKTYIFYTNVHANIAIYIKEGRYKFELTNFYIPNDTYTGPDEWGVITTAKSSPYKNPFMSQKRCNDIYLSYQTGIAITIHELMKTLEVKMTLEKSKLDF